MPPAATSPQLPAIESPEGSAACVAGLQSLYGKGIRPAASAATASSDLACRVVDPVIVETMMLGATSVEFEPAVTLSCEMAGRVAEWLGGVAQPLARGSFGRDLVRLQVGGGHECRRRNRSATGPLSEHATGRALDVFAFVLSGPAEGGKLLVERPDGDLQLRYLTAIRQSACGAFTTSIGPGADSAHANHLHLDIQSRRSASARFCQ